MKPPFKPQVVLLPALIASALHAGAAHPEQTIESIHELSPGLEEPVAFDRSDRDLRRAWQQAVEWYHNLSAAETPAHPRAAEFPGPVADDAERVAVTVSIDPNNPRWQVTGLYAAPGEAVTITVPEEVAELGWSVRVGSHTDGLWRRDEWKRFPVISRSFALDAPTIEVANAFGGLIYIDIPRDEERGGFHVRTYGGYGWINETPSANPSVDVAIEGAVRAPFFQLGVNDNEQWPAQLEQSGAPWGEIAGRHLTLTLPREVLETVEDPQAVAEFWDRVLDLCWEFAGWPGERLVAERFVFDEQISAGWMHSGYPIMAHLVSAENSVDLERLSTRGDWGFFHELGHNHQGRAYTFNSFVEVTVNLFTLYIMDRVCGLSPGEARSNFRDLEAVFRARLEDGRRGPFEELALYIPLIEEFGYESLTKTFQTYLSEEGSAGLLGRDDDARRKDEWARRYSLVVERDLTTYFDLFDIPASSESREAVAHLEPWFPIEGFIATFAQSMAEEQALEAEE